MAKTVGYTPCQDCDKVDSKTCEICEMELSRRPIGHWQKVRHPIWRGYKIEVCSVCGWTNNRILQVDKHQPNYCPRCGAEMDL